MHDYIFVFFSVYILLWLDTNCDKGEEGVDGTSAFTLVCLCCLGISIFIGILEFLWHVYRVSVDEKVWKEIVFMLNVSHYCNSFRLLHGKHLKLKLYSYSIFEKQQNQFIKVYRKNLGRFQTDHRKVLTQSHTLLILDGGLIWKRNNETKSYASTNVL